MNPLKIVSLSISTVSEKLLVFFGLIFPVIIFNALWRISSFLSSDEGFIFDLGIIIFFISMTIYSIKAVISIHRIIILEDFNNYTVMKNGSTFIKFAVYGIIISLIAMIPITTNQVWIVFLGNNEILGFILIIIAFFFAFFILSAFSFGFPVIAIGEKKNFLNLWAMFKLSKGFRITLFIQFMIVMIPYALLIQAAAYYLIDNVLMLSLLHILMNAYATILLACCVSNTYRLMRNK